MKYYADFILQSEEGFTKVEVINKDNITPDMVFIENCAEENRDRQGNKDSERWYNIYRNSDGKFLAVFDKEIYL